MARRRGRRSRRRRAGRRWSGDPALLLWGGALISGLVALRWLWTAVSTHLAIVAAGGVLLLAALAGAATLRERDRRAAAARRAELDRDIAIADAMTGPQFERYVARLMRRDGLRRVRVCGGSGDLGADVIGYTAGGRKVVVQCKRHSRPIGDPHIQRLNGTVWQVHGADVALLVTTARVTDNARRLARRFGITVVDRDRLAAWAAEGASPLPIE